MYPRRRRFSKFKNKILSKPVCNKLRTYPWVGGQVPVGHRLCLQYTTLVAIVKKLVTTAQIHHIITFKYDR